ncbi:ArdC-like ssDNA-binding domain-containing protein [Sphingobium sp. DN12]|uniref:ArdC-like ssDNA-binding domain-containing protein n=1 Tax=Sphingobium sp. DN12 TaxID=3378073 RepID=UPI003DA3E3AD
MGTGNGSLYDDVTQHIIAQLEEGRLPWVQPWDTSLTVTGLLRNAATGRCYSGINILILLDRLFERGYGAQRWIAYRQAQALGGNVRKGEVGPASAMPTVSRRRMSRRRRRGPRNLATSREIC